jgi:hypothetical protein
MPLVRAAISPLGLQPHLMYLTLFTEQGQLESFSHLALVLVLSLIVHMALDKSLLFSQLVLMHRK